MEGQNFTRLAMSVSLALGVLGCAVSNPLSSEPERVVVTELRLPLSKFKDENVGRIVGTIAVTEDILAWSGASSVAEAKVQAFDPDPAHTAVSDAVSVDANGNFVIDEFKASRPRIFVEATLGNVRFSSFAEAPRTRKDVSVILDPPSTYLADKLRRAALDKDVPFERLEGLKVSQTEAVVNIYMQDDERERVLTEDNPDLNAFAFDHFMEDHEPVKRAVYTLSPAVLRGWKPTPPPRPTPTPRTTPRPIATPTPSPTPDTGVK